MITYKREIQLAVLIRSRIQETISYLRRAPFSAHPAFRSVDLIWTLI